MPEFDVAVIGGGLVGASFVRAMVGAGLKIALLDHMPANSFYSQELDNRGLALSYTTKQHLQQLSCWEQLASNAYPITTVHVSEQHRFGMTVLEAKKYQLPALGYVVSASVLGAVLLDNLEQLPDLTVLRPVVIQDMQFEPHTRAWQIHTASQNITAKLIIAADGSDSIVRRLQNIELCHSEINQIALVTNLETTVANFTVAYERFTAAGVLALLPFGTHRAKCVLTGSELYIKALQNKTDAEFLTEIQAMIGYRIGRFTNVAARKIFPVQHCHAAQIYGKSVVLLGNAANTLHPVAAQGFNLGMRDAVTCAQILRQASIDNKRINHVDVLKKYSLARASDHVATRDFTMKLVDVFADPRPHVKLLRQAGLIATQLVPAWNKKMVRQGLGTCKS